MRDPATHINSKVEAAIKETALFFCKSRSEFFWDADPDKELVAPLRAKIRKIEAASDIPDQLKTLIIWRLFEEARKHRRKPRRKWRNFFIKGAADRLIAQGYAPTRNEATYNKESACSIICEALRRLGVPMKEKHINAIVLKWPHR